MYDIDTDVANSLSVTLLIIGIGMSIYPSVISKVKDKGTDIIHIVTIGVLLCIVILASQAIMLTNRYPDSLYPLVAITLGFRVISPTIMVKTMRKKYPPRSSDS